MPSLRTKICGITRSSDAVAAREAGADAIGLNFYTQSKRHVEPSVAADIAQRVRDSLQIVGVFVNSSAGQIIEISRQTGLTHIQLHGDEDESIVDLLRSELPTTGLIRAIRVFDDAFDEAQAEIDSWQATGVDLLLLDAATRQAFGGTGKQLPWEALPKLSIGIPWLLAGGLNPENVAQAIRIASPHGVDVASGVESQPGWKYESMIDNFVKEVASCKDALASQ